MKNTRHWCCLLALLPTLVVADVYQWTDQQGRRHYADRGSENAKILKIESGLSYFQVKKVFDGDTILLSNGQKIRFLGINTPEVAGRNKSAEAGGERAKAWLQEKLEHRKVLLQGDVEKQDKYQRTLAYVFSEDKQHINVELVRQGLATVNIYPPNFKYLDALLAAQQSAEQAKLGIWNDPAYAPVSVETLDETNYHGWKRLTGRIQAVKKTGKYSYLQFSDKVSINIAPESAALFPPLENYVGKTVEARGWVKRSKQRFVLPVRHPADIVLR